MSHEQLLQQAEANYAEHKRASIDKETMENYTEGVRETYQAFRLLASAYKRWGGKEGAEQGVILPGEHAGYNLSGVFDTMTSLYSGSRMLGDKNFYSFFDSLHVVMDTLLEQGYSELTDDDIEKRLKTLRDPEYWEDMDGGDYAKSDEATQKIYNESLDKAELHYVRNKGDYIEAAKEVAASEGVEIR